jgi:hypothetical protein
MKIVEGMIAATRERVSIVVINAGGETIEVGFRLRKDAVAYRNSLLALRRHAPNAMERHLEMVRRAQQPR